MKPVRSGPIFNIDVVFSTVVHLSVAKLLKSKWSLEKRRVWQRTSQTFFVVLVFIRQSRNPTAVPLGACNYAYCKQCFLTSKLHSLLDFLNVLIVSVRLVVDRSLSNISCLLFGVVSTAWNTPSDPFYDSSHSCVRSYLPLDRRFHMPFSEYPGAQLSILHSQPRSSIELFPFLSFYRCETATESYKLDEIKPLHLLKSLCLRLSKITCRAFVYTL